MVRMLRPLLIILICITPFLNYANTLNTSCLQNILYQQITAKSHKIHLSLAPDRLQTPLSKDAFIETYKTVPILSPEENLRFIQIAEQPKGKKPNYFVDIENAILKDLNDKVIKDKDFVTALENAYKLFLLDETKAHITNRQLTNVKALYSDYKSTRVVLSRKTKKSAKAFQQIYDNANQRFTKLLEHYGLTDLLKEHTGIAGTPEAWHLMGIGESADEATLAARFSRRSYSTKPITEFSEIVPELNTILNQIEHSRNQIEELVHSKTSLSKMLTQVPENNKWVLSQEAAELFRSTTAKSHAEYITLLKKRFYKRFKLNFNDDEIVMMEHYYQACDLFSPGIRSTKREIINLSQAQFGILSADFAGQGAKNAEQNFIALAKLNSPQAEQALVLTRQGEKIATEAMNQAKNIFAENIQNMQKIKTNPQQKTGPPGSIKFSGDDGIFFPTQPLNSQQKSNFVSSISQSENPAGLRIVFLADHYAHSRQIVSSGERYRWIVEGESLEKHLRTQLEHRNLYREFRNKTIAIDLTPINSSEAEVTIYLAGTNQINSVSKKILEKEVKNLLQVPGDKKLSLKQIIYQEGTSK